MTTLNQYIIDNATHGSGGEFLRKFGTVEVYFSIKEPNENLKDGPILVSPEIDLQMQTAQLPIGRMALFYTSKNDARLSQRFGGLPLIKAAEMVANLQQLDGMLVQSDEEAWFVADKQALKSAIGQMRSADFG